MLDIITKQRGFSKRRSGGSTVIINNDTNASHILTHILTG